MGFRTRVRFPPGPLKKIASNPVKSRIERFFLFVYNLITFDYLLKQENNIKKGESCTYDN